MRVLVSNPSLQYTRNTVKALLTQGHEVVFATAYWYKKNRFLERIISKTPFNKYLFRYSDAAIPDSIVLTNYWSIFLHFFLKFLPIGVEQKSYWEDLAHDRWVAQYVKKHQPQLTIGYEKSCLQTFQVLDQLSLVKWLDLSQVHPTFIQELRNKYSFFKSITGSDSLFKEINNRKQQEYELSNKIYCLSNFAANTLRSEKIPNEKIGVNPLGYNSKIFFADTNSHAVEKKPIQLVYAGIITKRKGIHLLLQLMDLYNEDQVELTLIGPAGDASSLLNEYLHKTNINYISFLSHEALADQFKQADLFVFPSYLDSWAVVVLEAMACGLPVIVTENTGAAQIVTDLNGKIIPIDNLQALKTALDYFIQYPDARLQMGKNASTTAVAHTWQNYNDTLNTMVSKLEQSVNYV
ncbi:MAG: glycosyltransferase family 4 protein [Sediminibacterium sp.]|nr:MAG: group 1 glycosyl [Chitinophagaceae bacterium]MDP1842875.1 glycosyltransferase family 4 protein [Sediminibacterium sp.]